MMARKNKGKKNKNKNKHKNQQQKQQRASVNTSASSSVCESRSQRRQHEDAEKRSLAQRRAEHALWCVQQVQEKSKGLQARYKSYARALPATILMSGLGQALAMEKAGATKGEDQGQAHRLLYQHLQSWLCNRLLSGEDAPKGWPHTPYATERDVLAAIVHNGEAAYLRAQAEALAYLEWLKKFAEALLEDDTDTEQEPAQQGEAR